MPFNVTKVANRPALVGSPENDFQSWKNVGSDGNTLQRPRSASAHRRCWCEITNHVRFFRLTDGTSFEGKFAPQGQRVIATRNDPGQTFQVTFTPPVIAVGLDVHPAPAAVILGQPYRVELEVKNTVSGETFPVKEDGKFGASVFVGAQCDTDAIDQLDLRVVMIDIITGDSVPVDFGINRLELLAPVRNRV